MSEFYDKMLALANRLITKYGQTGTISVPGTLTGPAHNAVDGAPTTSTVTLVELEYTVSEIDGSKVLASDKKLYLKADAPEPLKTATKITYGGKTFNIVPPVKPLNPGGTLLLYEAQARA